MVSFNFYCILLCHGNDRSFTKYWKPRKKKCIAHARGKVTGSAVRLSPAPTWAPRIKRYLRPSCNRAALKWFGASRRRISISGSCCSSSSSGRTLASDSLPGRGCLLFGPWRSHRKGQSRSSGQPTASGRIGLTSREDRSPGHSSIIVNLDAIYTPTVRP